MMAINSIDSTICSLFGTTIRINFHKTINSSFGEPFNEEKEHSYHSIDTENNTVETMLSKKVTYS